MDSTPNMINQVGCSSGERRTKKWANLVAEKVIVNSCPSGGTLRENRIGQ